jgi:hypothetical protein
VKRTPGSSTLDRAHRKESLSSALQRPSFGSASLCKDNPLLSFLSVSLSAAETCGWMPCQPAWRAVITTNGIDDRSNRRQHHHLRSKTHVPVTDIEGYAGCDG